MKRKTWIGILLSLTLLVLAVDYFFVHVLFPHKKRLFLEKLFEPVTASVTSSILPPGLKSEYAPIEAIGSDDFSLALKECLADSELRSSSSPQALIHNLEKKYGVQRRVFTSEKIHFTDAEKQEQRLLITSVSTPEGVVRELHLFTLTADHLPTPVELDPALTNNPTPDFLTNLLKDKTIVYDELKETIYFNKETPFVIEWVNGEPKEFQMVGDKKTLSCQYLHCSCQ